MNFATIIDGIGNDLKIAIDDLINQIKQLREDVEIIKKEKNLPDDNSNITQSQNN